MAQAADSGLRTQSGKKGGTRIIVARGENVRTYRFSPWLFGSLVSVLLLFLTAYIGGTGYLIFRDDVLTAAMARQVEIQYDYEDRISLLRSEIDRVTSRHIVETQSIEGQVASLIERQDGLRRQQVLLEDLVERARHKGISFASIVTPTPMPRPENLAMTEEEPIEESTTVFQPVMPGATKSGAPMAYSQDSGNPAASATDAVLNNSQTVPTPSMKPERVEPVLKDLRSSLERFEQLQAMTVHALKIEAAREAKRLTVAMTNLGINPPAPPRGLLDDASAQGGPFIPADTSNLLNGMVTIQHTLQHIDLLRNSSAAIPVRKPLPEIHMTSAFGYRVDPFLKKPGFHSGIDLRGAEGSPVSAAGAGKISHASAKGGYGLMVEITHGDGLKTRYGHLSSINVTVGQIVNAGDFIGQVGSTGRSTGPHLHYEAVRNGEAVDPAAFLATDIDL
jgi:murein DD-endopeptidase MepM/ murein hydrolase activator NlpD